MSLSPLASGIRLCRRNCANSSQSSICLASSTKYDRYGIARSQNSIAITGVASPCR